MTRAAWAALAAILVTAGCGGSDRPAGPDGSGPPGVASFRIVVEPVRDTFDVVGDARRLVANVVDAQDRPANAVPAWTSVHPHIVRVTPDGEAVALAPGNATLVARAEYAQAASVFMHVRAPARVRIAEVEVEGSTLSVRVVNEDGPGTYRLEAWSAPGTATAPLAASEERDAPPGLRERVTLTLPAGASAAYVVALTRPARAEGFEETGRRTLAP